MTQAQDQCLNANPRDIERIDPTNEVLVRDENSEATHKAYEFLLDAFKNLSELNSEEKDEIIKHLDQIFLEKKAQSYINVRMHSIFAAINEIFLNVSRKPPVKEVTNMYYYKSIKHHSVKDEW